MRTSENPIRLLLKTGVFGFPATCGIFLGGGTRIRTGDTTIFSHMRYGSLKFTTCRTCAYTSPFGSIPRSQEYASCRPYCCHAVAKPRHNLGRR